MTAVHSEQSPSPRNESFNEAFYTPKTTLDPVDQPCDVVLVVEDGKEFKAHRKVLSEASTFFEKLLNSDMKESQEGVVRLEMFSESVMAATLEFIYTGRVQISTQEIAQGLIVTADYLFLPGLKTPAEEVVMQKWNVSNCISTYYFAELYQCEELVSRTRQFILANFATLLKTEEFLSLSCKEVEMWISSDEIDVSAEEDVFKIILAWIDHDKSKRKKHFAELFRHVRHHYVSRDFLNSNVVTNDLVKDNKGCLDFVKGAFSSTDPKNCDYLSVLPRTSLRAPAIVLRVGANFLCYFPGENTWCKLGEIPSEYGMFQFFPCEGKLYGVRARCYPSDMVSYNPYTNSWVRLPPSEEDKCLLQIFVSNVEEMYALLSDRCPCLNARRCDREHSFFISKYKPESHSWEDILTVDHFDPNVRRHFCIVPCDHFIYFIGGEGIQLPGSDTRNGSDMCNVDRYDLSKGEWKKVADIQRARHFAYGVAVNGQVFIAGGNTVRRKARCEMYDETTNKWRFIATPKKVDLLDAVLAANGKMYAVSYEFTSVKHLAGECDNILQQISVQCYKPEKDEWEIKTEMAFPVKSSCVTAAHACLMRVFKRLPNIQPLETNTPESLSGATTT